MKQTKNCTMAVCVLADNKFCTTFVHPARPSEVIKRHKKSVGPMLWELNALAIFSDFGGIISLQRWDDLDLVFAKFEGSLLDLMQTHFDLESVSRQMISAVRRVHELGYEHCDLALRNFVYNSGRVVLIDMETCKPRSMRVKFAYTRDGLALVAAILDLAEAKFGAQIEVASEMARLRRCAHRFSTPLYFELQSILLNDFGNALRISEPLYRFGHTDRAYFVCVAWLLNCVDDFACALALNLFERLRDAEAALKLALSYTEICVFADVLDDVKKLGCVICPPDVSRMFACNFRAGWRVLIATQPNLENMSTDQVIAMFAHIGGV